MTKQSDNLHCDKCLAYTHDLATHKCDPLMAGLVKHRKQTVCNHVGDKTDFHPQFCRKCGAEFMYDTMTKQTSTTQGWQELCVDVLDGKEV